MVPEAAGLVALSLVLWAVVVLLKFYLAHKNDKTDLVQHEDALLKMLTENSKMLLEIILRVRRIDDKVNNKK